MDHVSRCTQSSDLKDFRAGQAEAVAAALADRDALVVMPTGSGKSLCYQLPALIRDDVTVVVSPLVSLMQDQAAALERVAPGRVGVINALRGALANAEAVDRAVAGELSLLYVAPERFASTGSSSGSGGRGSACSSSTRRTVCRSGATTSGPTTSRSRTLPGSWR